MHGREPETRPAGIVEAGIGRRGLLKAVPGLALGGLLAVRAAPTEAARQRRRARESGRQGAWRYCRKCRALHSVWDGNLGRCAAGGVHSVETSLDYWVSYATFEFSGHDLFQDDWRYCRKCRVLHSVWDGNLGRCAAGGVNRVETSF